ncbi:MAG: tetratricopeptide repeat protein [Verrucomicrobiia bacterium]
MKASVHCLVLACMLPLPLIFAGCATTAKDSTASVSCRDPRLKVFAAQKRQQTDELAAKLDLTVPPEARAFFQAAETGNWRAVSNAFERIRSITGPTETNAPAPGLNNVLFIPIHETFGAYEGFNSWDGTLLQKYADDMLHSLPNGSIYFGGTAAGRFIITTVRDVANSPDIFILTQNWLGDARYMDYLRLLYGARLSIPSEQDVQQAVQEATRDAQARQTRGEHPGTDDCCRSAEENMNINATLAKWIFDHNKAHHEVYFEESSVIPWMFPYLEPHGLIMKLNNEPLAQLDSSVVARDHQFWDALTKTLLADPSFLRNERARQTYGKLRSAIGGLYVYGQRLTNDAEVAFKQAIALNPTGPEANFRLAQLYTEQGRIDEAMAVLKSFQQHDPTNRYVQAAITQMQTVKQSGLRSVIWLTGPSFFRQGDSIMITEVRASSSEFKVGDTVKVTGRYTLASKPRALLCLNVTATGKGDAWESQALEQELQVPQGSGEFVLPATIQQAGHLHLTFYDVDTGNPFGGFYFGTGPQMQEIANWNVRSWYAKE